MLVGLCEKEVLNCWCRIFTRRKAGKKKNSPRATSTAFLSTCKTYNNYN